MFNPFKNTPRNLICAILLLAALASGQTGQAPPASLTVLDEVIEGLLAKYPVPGAALAISRNGILVYARGFGMADTASSTPVQPDSIFRVGSVSKTFTAIATMELVEQGRVQLDQPAFALLPNLQPLGNAKLNAMLANVTVRELLNMTGGWDRTIITDPVDNTIHIASVTGMSDPLSCPNVIAYQLSQPLQHPAGSTYVYSNFGYCILGAIISQVSGMPYEAFIYRNVLQPLAIERALQAEGLMSDKVNGEVTYYDAPGAALATNVYNPGGPPVPAPYGNHNFLASNASGSWATTPIELLRFINGMDGTRGGPLLQPATIQEMQTEAAAFNNAPDYYGLGFDMTTVTLNGSPALAWSKDGGLPGTSAYLFRGADKIDWAVTFNSSPDGGAEESSTATFENDYVGQIKTAIAGIKTWPTTDQFPAYPSTLQKAQFAASGTPVQNAASFQPSITPGSWVSLYGTNLATASREWYNGEFNGAALPVYVDGVSVTIGGETAPVYYVSPGQLNVQAPAGLTPGPAPVVVTHNGLASNSVMAQVVASSAALFTYAAGGNTYAAAVFPDGAPLGDPSVQSGTLAAKPGDYLQLFGTGFGSAPSGAIIGTSMPLSTLPAVTIGGTVANVTYAGLVGAGLFQVNVQIPQNMQPGNQPVVVSYGGATSPSGVVIPVAAQ